MAAVWSPDEMGYLLEIVGSDSFPALAYTYNRTARAKGWPERSVEALRTQIKKRGRSRLPMDGGWSAGGLARILGCSGGRVRYWIRQGLLRSSRVSRQHRILAKDFRKFARANPRVLAGLSRDGLEFLLPETTLSLIDKCPPPTRGIPLTVVNLDSGRVYRSLREAQESEYLSRGQISLHARAGTPSSSGQRYAIAGAGERYRLPRRVHG